MEMILPISSKVSELLLAVHHFTGKFNQHNIQESGYLYEKVNGQKLDHISDLAHKQQGQ